MSSLTLPSDKDDLQVPAAPIARAVIHPRQFLYTSLELAACISPISLTITVCLVAFAEVGELFLFAIPVTHFALVSANTANPHLFTQAVSLILKPRIARPPRHLETTAAARGAKRVLMP